MAKEIDVRSPKINNLVLQIEAGEIKVPPLQRPFVWEINQIIELLESIYKDYPIGSILLWETNLPLPEERNIAGFKLPQKPPAHPFYYVLDGQQRLSSLYGVFCKDRTLDTPREGYTIDATVFEILFDLEEFKFIPVSERISGKDYFELKSLFDTEKMLGSFSNLNAEKRKVVQDLYAKFTNYEVPIIITKKRDIEEVGVIFERVNNTGTKLDLFDLMVALTWRPDFHLQNSFNEILQILDKKNFGDIKNKILLQSMSVIITESCRTKVITSLKGEDIRQKVDVLKESLMKTIDYLSTQLNIGSDEVLPHAHQVVPLCYFFSHVNTPNADQLIAINKWFFKTSFSLRYSSGTDKNVDEDVQFFKELIYKGNLNSFDKLKYTVTADQLKITKLSKSNSLSRAVLVLLGKKGPMDLTNGSKVDVGQSLSSFNKKEYHHIFPDAFLRSKGVDNQKINSLSNFSLLPAGSNKIISDKAPSDYFQNIIPKKLFKPILESNLLPLKQDIYLKDEYDNFLEERSIKMMEFLEEQLI